MIVALLSSCCCSREIFNLYLFTSYHLPYRDIGGSKFYNWLHSYKCGGKFLPLFAAVNDPIREAWNGSRAGFIYGRNELWIVKTMCGLASRVFSDDHPSPPHFSMMDNQDAKPWLVHQGIRVVPFTRWGGWKAVSLTERGQKKGYKNSSHLHISGLQRLICFVIAHSGRSKQF